jgi:hypothetical protein
MPSLLFTYVIPLYPFSDSSLKFLHVITYLTDLLFILLIIISWHYFRYFILNNFPCCFPWYLNTCHSYWILLTSSFISFIFVTFASCSRSVLSSNFASLSMTFFQVSCLFPIVHQHYNFLHYTLIFLNQLLYFNFISLVLCGQEEVARP